MYRKASYDMHRSGYKKDKITVCPSTNNILQPHFHILDALKLI